MKSCYLTIDDSPSTHTDEMIDFLAEKQIPALLFCRGDFLESDPDPVIRAIKMGFVIGNHSYAHKPFGTLSYDEAVADIEKCDRQIEVVYERAGVTRHGKYFRFPYLDRGNGDRIERHFEKVSAIDINDDPQVQSLQTYLNAHGYTQPFQTDHPLYTNASISKAADCLMTYSSFDWMLTDRHIGQWDYKTIEDLKRRIDGDPNLNHASGNILIFHDQPGLIGVFKSLIDHMILNRYEFLSVK